MKISDKRVENIFLTLITLGIFFLGWISFPFIANNSAVRVIFYTICISIPTLYFVNIVSINYKSGLFSFLAGFIIIFLLSFSFSGIYHDLDFENELTWFYIFILFSINGSVLWYDSFEKITNNIDETLEIIWGSIFFGGLILGGKSLFQLINGSVIPPWDELTAERKAFYLFRIIYFFLLSYFGFKLKSNNKVGVKPNHMLISCITLIFVVYMSITIYMKVSSNYFEGNFHGLTREILSYLGFSYLLIYSIQILNHKLRFDFEQYIMKVYKLGLFTFALIGIIPWLALILSEHVVVLNKFFNSKQESLVIIIISSISTSVISNLFITYCIAKREKENKNNKTLPNKSYNNN